MGGELRAVAGVRARTATTRSPLNTFLMCSPCATTGSTSIPRASEWSGASASVGTAGAAAADGLGGRFVVDLEGVAAAAGRRDVRVFDLEAGLLEPVEEVDAGALEVRSAVRVDDDPHAVQLELVVALLDAAVEAERVLEAGASAA